MRDCSHDGQLYTLTVEQQLSQYKLRLLIISLLAKTGRMPYWAGPLAFGLSSLSSLISL
jgi:hypothetical protein